jgi:hypothetical protein
VAFCTSVNGELCRRIRYRTAHGEQYPRASAPRPASARRSASATASHEYEVVGGDGVETYPQGNRTAVGFTETVAPGDSVTLSYFVTVGSDPGAGTFGPVEGSADGTEWDVVGGTTDSNLGTGFTV